jgi:P-type conjugative transfer protein TrbJ
MSTKRSTFSPPRSSRRSNPARAVLAGLLLAGTWSGVALPAREAAAQQVVFDPTNHVENALQAARQLEALANDAAQLANEAQMLAQSPLQYGARYSETLRAINDTARAARGIAADVTRVERQFQSIYSGDLRGRDLAEMTRAGAERVRIARRTAEDVARLAAEVQRLGAARSTRLGDALAASEAATGQTAAVQSQSQIMGVLAEDLASLRTVTLAQSRLLAEATARESADRAQGAELRRRLWARKARTSTAAPGFNPLSRARN